MVKKLLLIAMLVPFLLFMGCELFESDPELFGNWLLTNTAEDYTTNLTFNEDMTYSYVVRWISTGTIEEAASGTFTYTESSFTMTSTTGNVEGPFEYILDEDNLTIDGNLYVRQ